MTDKLTWLSAETDKPLILYEGLVGSHLHRTANTSSDLDVRVIFRDRLWTRTSPFGGTKSFVDKQHDTTYYELGHFVSMLWKCNPTAVEICFAKCPTGRFMLPQALLQRCFDAQKYLDQGNGLIMGMVRKDTPKSRHHAARMHTHLTLFAETGDLIFNTTYYDNYEELLDIKNGTRGLDPKYTEKVTNPQVVSEQDRSSLEELVADLYFEDLGHIDKARLDWVSTRKRKGAM